MASGPTVHVSKGMTPFGYAVSSKGQLIVSEAFGGMDTRGAASSYDIGSSITQSQDSLATMLGRVCAYAADLPDQ